MGHFQKLKIKKLINNSPPLDLKNNNSVSIDMEGSYIHLRKVCIIMFTDSLDTDIKFLAASVESERKMINLSEN